jgi:CBS domain-containing protein
MDDSHSIASLFPNLFKSTKPITVGSNALIISANLLHLDEAQMLPIVLGLDEKIDPSTKIKMFATLGGYSVLSAILKTDPKDYLKLLWRPCQEFPSWIGSVKYTDALDVLLKVFNITRFGDAAVEGMGTIPALVTLQDILPLYKNDTIKSTLSVSEIGSERVEISPDASLADALRMMFERRVRRVFLSSERRNSISFMSSRNIIRFLFSPERLEIVKEYPERWLNAKLSDIDPSEAKIIADGKIVNQAASEIGDRVDDCLACEHANKVVTRWDIIMKPWKTGNYLFAGIPED